MEVFASVLPIKLLFRVQGIRKSDIKNMINASRSHFAFKVTRSFVDFYAFYYHDGLGLGFWPCLVSFGCGCSCGCFGNGKNWEIGMEKG